MEVCPSCGTIAPTSSDECGRCFTPFGQPRLRATPPPGGLMLARLFGEFDCRSCGSKVALNGFTLGGYLCASCGIEQKFDWDLWEDIITHAHDTADVTGFYKPSFEDNFFWKALAAEEGDDIARMFKSIGLNKSTLSKGNSSFGGLEYEVDVSPGNPICDSCAKPLSVSADETSLRVGCSGCNSTSTYSLCNETARYKGLLGIVSHENRTDAPSVHAEAAPGGVALAISCPNCTGALELGSLGEVVICPFCATTCHVPQRVFQKASGKPVARQAWWMVFSGKSKQRSSVEKRIGEFEREARDDQTRKEAWEAHARLATKRARRKEARVAILVAILIAAGVGLLIALNLLGAI